VYCLRPEFKQIVTVLVRDVRAGAPDDPMYLLLCRNLVFTYFDMELQRDLACRFVRCLRPGGALVVGAHEVVPEDTGFLPWPEARNVYTKSGAN
jgi:chemotaxis protein methyltransferase CheR